MHQTYVNGHDCRLLQVIMWELWTGQEPYEGVPLHALLHQLLVCPGTTLSIPGSDDWQEVHSSQGPVGPAHGWCGLMQRCWRPADQRPTARQLVLDLEGMLEALREARRSKRQSAA
jgi:hypothetical protein